MTQPKPEALLLATLDTKAAETEFLAKRIESSGLQCRIVDVSLQCGEELSGRDKVDAMQKASARSFDEIEPALNDNAPAVAVGIGGGTGTQICASVLEKLPSDIPKLLVTTMAQDPRTFAAETGIILIPTVVDLSGLNAFVRDALDRAATVAASLAKATKQASEPRHGRAVAVTGLGVTSKGVEFVTRKLAERGHEPIVFHANGYGGNALQAKAATGDFDAVVDFTIHEAAALLLNGSSVVRRNRIRSYSNCPCVLLPGGANFYTEECLNGLSPKSRRRLHYHHSPAFAHVAFSTAEMGRLGKLLGAELAVRTTATAVVLPMGGFSSEDKPGGEIENPDGRAVFRDALRTALGGKAEFIEIVNHINDEETASVAVEALQKILPSRRANNEHG